MSQENVEAFKGAFEAGSCQDVEALLAELDPDVEWHAALPMLGGDAVYRRHEGLRAFLPEVWEVLADTQFEFPEIRDVGDQVVAVGRLRGRGKGSGSRPRHLLPTWSTSGAARRSGFAPTSIPSPRSRRATGVGDVARER
jgi:ketosteroid isomerase-like protein